MDIRKLHEHLVEMHGEPERSDSVDGLRQLLITILSQNVGDTDRARSHGDRDSELARASKNLFSKYYNYYSMRVASLDDLADTIESAGSPKVKAKRIKRVLTRVRQETGGEYELGFIGDMEPEDAKAWLTGIKGVGPKTADVVIRFYAQRPSIAVGVHVERVAKRFGIVPEDATNQECEDILEEKVPDELKRSLHVLLIRHGQEYCLEDDPDCDNPVCNTYCDCSHC